MGNYNESTVNGKLIIDILEKRDTRSAYYPLTDIQSQELYQQYCIVLNKIIKVLPRYNEICPYIIVKTQTHHVIDMIDVGYFRGKITAFLFSDTDKPCIIIEDKNNSFKKSVKLLKQSYKSSCHHPNNNGYQSLLKSKILNMTIMNLPGEVGCEQYYFVTDVSLGK